jgi:hypothetical protein
VRTAGWWGPNHKYPPCCPVSHHAWGRCAQRLMSAIKLPCMQSCHLRMSAALTSRMVAQEYAAMARPAVAAAMTWAQAYTDAKC